MAFNNLGVAAAALSVALSVNAADWFVDSERGNDAADGLSAAAAVKTLTRVNALDVKPGDRVLFKRGGLWRGTLRPRSGEPGVPVLYGTYGSGPKPILQGSIDRSREADWVDAGNGLWATLPTAPTVHDKFWEGSDLSGWDASYQEGNKGQLSVVNENGERFVRVTLEKKVRAANNLLQLWGPMLRNLPDSAVLKLKVRSTKPFRLGCLRIGLGQPPWTAALSGQARMKDSKGMIGPEWSTVLVSMARVPDAPREGKFHFSIGDVMPEGAVFDFIPVGLWRSEINAAAIIPVDVGMLVLDHGRKWGVKKWNNPEWEVPDTPVWRKATTIEDDLDYWYDEDERRVFMKYPRNPAKDFKSIELGIRTTIVNEGGCHDVVYDGLAVRYGAAHGFGGGNTVNITIRNCDIYWIGGGCQFWRRDPKTGKIVYPVRFGNGIEFWGACRNNLVERNRLWQIYDAALTNQTKDDTRPETEVTWRDNVVWQAEYSFEYWNHDLRSFTRNVIVEHNTFVDAGYCWSHDQRPNPNGAHLMMYDNAAPTTNFVVRNNLFVRTTDRSSRFCNDWRVKDPAANDGLTMDHNLYWIPENKVCEYHVNGRERRSGNPKIRTEPGSWGAGPEEFARYCREFAIDAGSVYGEPRFVNESARDYRLVPGSFGTNLASDGGPLGARDMPGLDSDQSKSATVR